MTTIAYRDGVLAGDGLYHRGGWKMGNTHQKVWKTPDGRLVGICGDAAHVSKLVAWLLCPPRKRTTERPKLEKDTGTVVEVFGNGKARYYEHDYFHPVNDRYWSVGSGSIAALVAMDMGADAVRAIKIAAKRDDSTGGRISAVKLKEK